MQPADIFPVKGNSDNMIQETPAGNTIKTATRIDLGEPIKADDKSQEGFQLDNRGNLLWISKAGAMKELIKQTKKAFPKELIDRHFPKRFSVPPTHHDPAIYSFAEMGSLMKHDDQGQWDGADSDFNANTIKKAHEELSRMNYPTFFLQQTVLDMLNNTNMGDSVPLDKIKFPLNSFIITLPKGGHIQKQEGLEDEEVVAISVTKTFDIQTDSAQLKAKELQLPDTHGRFYTPELNGAVMDALKFSEGEEDEILQGVEEEMSRRLGEEAKLIPSISFIIVMANGEVCTGSYPIASDGIDAVLTRYKSFYEVDDACGEVYEYKSDSSGQDIADLKEGDLGMMHEMIALAVKVVLFMTARGEEWDYENRMDRKPKVRKGRTIKEGLWSPNWIGLNKAKPSHYEGEGEGGKQRYHWRSGHFKGQRYGKGMKKVKVIWIEPYAVNTQ